jgi:DNA-binding HxlR family transcriptional regulator
VEITGDASLRQPDWRQATTCLQSDVRPSEFPEKHKTHRIDWQILDHLRRLGSEEKISQRVLTLKLRTLERDGMVARNVVDSSPPKISYELTALGRELYAEANRLIAWAIARETPINEARARFDQATTDDFAG